MTDFDIFPAIDLRGGQVVRLRQGDPDHQTTYDHHPGGVARQWLKQGARWLHVVNLDGAFGEEDNPNQDGIQEIVKEARQAGAKVQLGGGIRSPEDIDRLLSLGIQGVILGTAAAQNPELVEWALVHYGSDRIVVGVDARGGKVRVQGWTEGTKLEPLGFGRMLRKRGLEWSVYTDITRDGVGKGLNVEAARIFQEETGLNVIAAGGVASLDDIRAARDAGLWGVIIGRALYEGELDLARALKFNRGGH